MPRDQRLYMTFPIDFWTHPKVARLSDAAFRTFVESNGHSRMRETDGRIESEDAEFMWSVESLAELIRSHPIRPLMEMDGNDYVLRDYAEHQFTKADRDDLSRKRSEAGAKGAAAKASAKQVLSKPEQAEAEIGIGKGITTTPNGVVDRAKRAHSIPLSFSISDQMREWGATNAPLVDLDAKLPEFIDYWRGVGKPMKDWESVWHNGMRKQQTFAERDAARGPQSKASKAAQNAARYRELFDGSEGSIPAIDPGIG